MRHSLMVLVLTTLPILAKAECTKPACFVETRWHTGFTAVVVQDRLGSPEHKSAVSLIESLGGSVAVHSNHIILGWIPPAADASLLGRHGIRSIHRQPGTLSMAIVPRSPKTTPHEVRPRQDDALVAFFESVVSGRLASEIDKSIGVVGPPLHHDVFDNPALAQRLGISAQPGAATSTKGMKHLSVGATNTNGPPWTNDSMRNEVCVIGFEMQSDGSLEQSRFNWSVEQYGPLTGQILNGITWWADRAREHGISVHFGMCGVWEPYSLQTQTGYEPLNHYASDDYLWVNDILRKQDTNPPYYTGPLEGRPGGFGASPITPANVFAQAEQYNAYIQQQNGCTSGFTIYIAADNGQPYGFPYWLQPSTSQQRSYSYYGGPFMQTTYTNGGWGADQFYIVMWHETGHQFWACDEYWDTPSSTGCTTCGNCRTYGPRLDATNANCGNPNPQNPPGVSCQTHVACIMDRAESLSLCNSTPYQIGW